VDDTRENEIPLSIGSVLEFQNSSRAWIAPAAILAGEGGKAKAELKSVDEQRSHKQNYQDHKGWMQRKVARLLQENQ
jgi:hypothetical protein